MGAICNQGFIWHNWLFKMLPAEVMFPNAIRLSILHKRIYREVQEQMGIPVQASPAILCLVHSSSVIKGVLFITIIRSCKAMLIWKSLLCHSFPKVVLFPLSSFPNINFTKDQKDRQGYTKTVLILDRPEISYVPISLQHKFHWLQYPKPFYWVRPSS